MDNQWSKQKACFARATRVWLAVNHSICVTSGKWVRCSKRIAWASEFGSSQSNLCNSWGYERLQKYKDSLKDCFKNVNINFMTTCYITLSAVTSNDDIRDNNANIHWNKQTLKVINSHLKGHMINRIILSWSLHIKFIMLTKGLFNKFHMK